MGPEIKTQLKLPQLFPTTYKGININRSIIFSWKVSLLCWLSENN